MSKKKKKSSINVNIFILLAFVLSIVSLVLMLFTTGIITKGNILGLSGTNEISGLKCIFGSNDDNIKANWAGITSFILGILGIIFLVLAILGGTFKLKSLRKQVLPLSLISALCLILTGVFMLVMLSAFKSANGISNSSLGGFISVSVKLGAGWIVGGILAISSGICTLVPLVFKK